MLNYSVAELRTKTNTNNYEKVIINTRLCDDKFVRISAGKDCCGRS